MGLATFLELWHDDKIRRANEFVPHLIKKTRERIAAQFLLDPRPLAEKQDEFKAELSSDETSFLAFVIGEYHLKKKNETVSIDDGVRGDANLAGLTKLKPAFKMGGSVTAGNSSQMIDGAAAVLVVSEEYLKRIAKDPIARFLSFAVKGVPPEIMGIGPVGASKKALKRAGLNLKDIDVIELNEAFAAQSLACIREMGLEDNDPRINPNGGAIALGHPLGMTGQRLLQTASIQLQETGGKYALATMCVGVGQGYAAIIERV